MTTHDDAGETLIEMVLSILFVSLSVVMILAAIGTGTTLTSSHKTLTDTDVALKRAAELVKAQSYVVKATAASYPLTSLTGLNGVTVTVSSVKCLPTSSGSQDVSAATVCTTTDTGLQVVSLSATASGTSEQTVVLKRKTS